MRTCKPRTLCLGSESLVPGPESLVSNPWSLELT